MSDSPPQTLNIPSLLIFLALTFLAIRYFFFTPSSFSSSASSRPRGRQIDPAQIEQISQMFPQVGRREIMWDLQRNGGSVQATTERLLGGGGLEVPPPSFQPVLPPLTTASAAPSAAPEAKPTHPDLITRYNLASRIGEPSVAGRDGEAAPAPLWSSNKNERQALLQRRREEMVLNARRKMEEKERERRGG